MNCPECGVRAFTKDTRHITGNRMRRRYQCPLCAMRFSTMEAVITASVEGRDAFGRFTTKNKPARNRETLPSCGQCNHWLHDGCGLQLRPSSRSRRFSRACDDFMLRYGPEAPSAIGRGFAAKYMRLGRYSEPRKQEKQKSPVLVVGGRQCRSCAFSWGGKCDLGLPKPEGKKCGSYVSALAVEEEEAV